MEILFCWLQRERIDFEISGFQAYTDVGTAEQLGEAFKAPAEVENECVRLVFLEIRNDEIQQETFSSPGSPQDHGVGDVSVVKIQKVRCSMIRLQDREVFLPKMRVPRLATVK